MAKTTSWLDEPVFREAYPETEMCPGFGEAYVKFAYAAANNRTIGKEDRLWPFTMSIGR